MLDKVQTMIRGIGNHGGCKVIASEGNMEMKYDINSIIPPVWNDLFLVKFKTYITTKLLAQKILGKEGYCIARFNLLRNTGFIPVDHNHHYDYTPRVCLL